jgi:hypothetical protein
MCSVICCVPDHSGPVRHCHENFSSSEIPWPVFWPVPPSVCDDPAASFLRVGDRLHGVASQTAVREVEFACQGRRLHEGVVKVSVLLRVHVIDWHRIYRVLRGKPRTLCLTAAKVPGLGGGGGGAICRRNMAGGFRAVSFVWCLFSCVMGTVCLVECVVFLRTTLTGTI